MAVYTYCLHFKGKAYDSPNVNYYFWRAVAPEDCVGRMQIIALAAGLCTATFYNTKLIDMQLTERPDPNILQDTL